MKRIFPLIAAFICIAAVSCTKPVVRTDYRLTVTWQERKAEKDPLPLTTASAYAFYVDPNQWEVASIDDAREGVITAVGDPSVKQTYDMTVLAEGEHLNVFSFEFDTQPVMLLVADRNYPMWATGNANVVPNLSVMDVTLNFTPLTWKEGDDVPTVKAPWKFYGYDNVKIPIDTELDVIPTVLPAGSVTSELLKSGRCFAFYGMSKGEGKVTSWQQASSGFADKLVKEPEEEAPKEEEQEEQYTQVRYDVTAAAANDTIKMKITDPKVMVVVCNDVANDTETKMYAYAFFDLTDNPYVKVSGFTFDLNKSTDSWVSDPWNIFLEKPRVVE